MGFLPKAAVPKTFQGVHQACAWVLCVLVFLSPLPFGAVEAWAAGVLEVFLFSLLIAVLGLALFSGRSIRLPHLAAAALFLTLHLVQIAPLPARVLEQISPTSWYIFHALRPDDTGHLYRTISVSPDVTISSLFWFSGCLAAFYFIGMVRRRSSGPGRDVPDHRKRRVTFFGIPARNRTVRTSLALLFTLTAAGVFQALYGLAEHILGWNRIFFYVRRYPMEGVAGTFINANSCAAFLAICLPLTLSLILYMRHFTDRKPDKTQPGGKKTVAGPMRYRLQILILSAAAALIALALVFTRSGGGIISSSSALLLFSFYFLLRRPAGKSLMPFLIILALALVCLSSIGLFIAPDFTMTTLVTETSGKSAGRFTVWLDSMIISRDFPLFGSGAGTYQHMMLHYFNRMVVRAHNEYVELFCDHGPLGLLVILLVLLYFGRLVRTLLFRNFRKPSRSRPRSLPSSYILPLGVSVSLFGLMVHCLVDFPLRIPAIALAASCLVGVLAALSARRIKAPPARRRAGHFLLILVFAVLLCGSSIRLFEAAARSGAGYDGLYATARGEIDRLSADDRDSAAPAVRSCILARPLDIRGHRLAFDLARHRDSSIDMERALVHGTLARPALSQTFHALGQFLVEQGRFGEGLACFRRSLELDADYLDSIYGFCMQVFAHRFALFEFIFPKDPELREQLGDLLRSSGLVDLSLEQYQWCLTQRPDQAKIHSKVAQIHRDKHDYAEALAAIGEALRLDPSGRDSYSFVRATILLQMGEVAGAMEQCQALLSVNPGHEGAYSLLAMCHLERGEVWNAISVYRAALWRVAEKSRFHRLLGDQYSKLGKLDEALEEYQASSREASTEHERKFALYRMGTSYEQLNMRDKALDAMKEADAIGSAGKGSLDRLIDEAMARLSAGPAAGS